MLSQISRHPALNSVRLVAVALLTSTLIVACGGGGSSTPAASTVTIGGTVTGLSGSGLVLKDNGSDSLAVHASGTFTFATAVSSGGSYSVTVGTQPSSPTQTCAVANGSGTASADVTNVTVTCTTSTFTVGGTVSGLTGTGLILQTNGGHSVSINASGTFTFDTLPSGTAYTVTVQTQPSNPAQVCTPTSNTGTVTTANITNVVITCVASPYSVGGNVSGLAGTGLVLSNGSTNIPISGNGTGVVFTHLAGGATYNFTVQTQPSSPAQTCAIANASGTVGAANVTNVNVTCVTNTYAVGGTVSGLAGTGLVLSNGATNIPVTANGVTVFATLASGTAYSFTVHTQPTSPTQVCAIANAANSVAGAPVTNVNVTCITTTFNVKVSISGLANASNAVVLQDNGADNLSETTNATFPFATQVASGAPYAVTVLTQPTTPAQYCAVYNGSGTVAAADITVTVLCRGPYAFVSDATAGTVSEFSVSTSGALTSINTSLVEAAASVAAPQGVAAVTLPQGAGTFVYTANQGTADVSVLTVGADSHLAFVQHVSTGAAPATPTSAGSTPTAITVDPSGKFVLVTDSDNAANSGAAGFGGVLVFPINQTTGALGAAVTGSPFATDPTAGQAPISVAVDPTDTYAFAVNQFDATNGLAGFGFNATSGALAAFSTANVGSGPNPDWVAVDPNASDPFAYVANNFADSGISGYTIGTGTATSMGAAFTTGFTAGATPAEVLVDPTGNFLYATDSANGQVVGFTVSQTNGALTAIAAYSTGSGGGSFPFAEAIDPTGTYLYVGNTFDGTISLFTITAGTGVLTASGAPTTVNTNTSGIAIK